jgi:uncharacterized protein (DUF1697 family)
MTSYIALLRGINVGGNNMIKMADLKVCLEKAGFQDVKTYIQSGNVLLKSNGTNTAQLAQSIESAIEKQWHIPVGVAVRSEEQWQGIIQAAPQRWGKDTSFKHNLLVMLEPYDIDDALAAIGELKPKIESVTAGDGVLYQSLSWELFGRTTSGKLAGKPIYKRMTVRNYNTSIKLLALLEDL